MANNFHAVRISQPLTLSLTVILTALVFICAGCGSGELSRSQVKSAVEASPEFTQPATVDLTNPYENQPSSVDKKSADETVEGAKARDLQTFLESFPDIAAANHLGYIIIEQTLIKEIPYTVGTMIIPGWQLTRRSRAGKRGKQLWQEMKLPVSEEALPIGKKEFVAVSGITKQGEAQAIADFTYKWKPNELGRALDERTEEFKKLPEEVRTRLTQKKGLMHASSSIDWSGERQGKAIFQKYDDGWRLVRIL